MGQIPYMLSLEEAAALIVVANLRIARASLRKFQAGTSGKYHANKIIEHFNFKNEDELECRLMDLRLGYFVPFEDDEEYRSV